MDSDGIYTLYWSYNLNSENISFAILTQTTGWIGFGILHNGKMINSNVTIGWVDENGPHTCVCEVVKSSQLYITT